MLRSSVLLLLRGTSPNKLLRLTSTNMMTSSIKNLVKKSTVLDDFLRKNNSDTFYAEYDGFLSNHLAYAAIVLHEIDADDNHLSSYLDHYKTRLEPPDGPTARNQREDTADMKETIDALLGQRKGFYRILKHFKGLFEDKYHGSVDALLKEEFPKLSGGLIGSALHPLIHIGYGLSADSSAMVLEGLAYLHHSYMPMVLNNPPPDVATFGCGGKDLLEVIEEVRLDDDLFEYMEENCVRKLRELGDERNLVQASVNAVFDRGDRLMGYAHEVRVPPEVEGNNAEQLMRWVVDQAVRVYVGSVAKNDFFLLHGVTSAWALKQLAPKLRPADQTAVVRTFLCALLAVYLAQGRPRILPLNGPDVGGVTWEELRARLLAKRVSEVDEHDFKLFQVCRDQWTKYGDAEMEPVYKRAILTNLENQMRFTREED